MQEFSAHGSRMELGSAGSSTANPSVAAVTLVGRGPDKPRWAEAMGHCSRSWILPLPADKEGKVLTADTRMDQEQRSRWGARQRR